MVCAAKVILVVVSLNSGVLTERGDVSFHSFEECEIARGALQTQMDKTNWFIGTPTAVCRTVFGD